MDNFISEYTKRCKSEVLKYGFKQRRQVFSRIVNDVYQNFYVEKLGLYPDGRGCRVGFAVLPLCQRLEAEQVSNGMGIYYLRRFEVTHWTEGDGWRYKAESTSISNCIEEIMRYLISYLLPFFERADSCETALQELINLEKLFNDNRIASLKMNGMEDKAGSDAELRLSDSAKYFMALKNGDYNFALKSRKSLEQQNTNAYNSMSEKGYLTDEDRIRREKNLSKLRDEITYLEASDRNYFQRVIEENEAYSREALKGIL